MIITINWFLFLLVCPRGEFIAPAIGISFDTVYDLVKDSRMLATSSLAGYNDYYGRLNRKSHWCTEKKNPPGEEYLGVSFTDHMIICGIGYEGVVSSNKYMNHFEARSNVGLLGVSIELPRAFPCSFAIPSNPFPWCFAPQFFSLSRPPSPSNSVVPPPKKRLGSRQERNHMNGIDCIR